MIKLTAKGSFRNSERFFTNSKQLGEKFRQIMDRYGRQGVDALQSATPQDTGETAKMWSYSINNWGLEFSNSNVNQGIPIVILIQYGHGTRNGGYVQGRDFINPALQPIFDRIVKDMTKEVQNL